MSRDEVVLGDIDQQVRLGVLLERVVGSELGDDLCRRKSGWGKGQLGERRQASKGEAETYLSCGW